MELLKNKQNNLSDRINILKAIMDNLYLTIIL